NASDNWIIDHYWLNDTTHFQINSISGIITNTTILTDLSVHDITIHVNDTSGNEINASITITNVDDIFPTWDEVPGNQTIYYEHVFQYLVKVSDNVAIDHYWLDETFYFAITQEGLLQNLAILALGDYYLTIHVNDTSGNEINVSITISVINEPDSDIPGFEMLWVLTAMITSVFIAWLILKKRKNSL
ncbi:MAG: hypothetical protein HWN66_12480, partial [Candidatus Helarchaeota archaeon]|nr:hypothetical protein [Candidatus Helarchaeota archaeon]